MALKISIIIALNVVVFIAICVYFDQKRRKDPDFKQKLKARKKAEKAAKKESSAEQSDDMYLKFLKELEMSNNMINYNKAKGVLDQMTCTFNTCDKNEKKQIN